MKTRLNRFICLPWQVSVGMLALALASIFAPALTHAGEATHKGVAVIVGGALSHNNTEVWSRIVQLSTKDAKTKPNWLVIPTASGSPESSAKRLIESLEAAGARAEMIPLSREIKSVKVEELVRDATWIRKIEAADGVYFAGGAQERITAALFTADGKNTPMLDAIWKMYRAGGVVAGSSAGAAIMSATMFREPKPILDIMREGATRGSDIDRGLGFVGEKIFVDQHFLKRGRIGRMLPVMAQEGFSIGLGIEENSAAIVRGDEMEVIGAKGVIVAELKEAKKADAPMVKDHADSAPGAVFQASSQAFTLRDARVSYLDRGDKMNLATRAVTVAAHKRGPRGNLLDHTHANFKPYYDRVRFFPDMLGDNTFLNAMTMLVDSRSTEARGLAFESTAKSSTNIGFEFRLFKTPETRGYFSSALGSDDYTVIGMGLDVLPVTMANPLFTPLSPSLSPLNPNQTLNPKTTPTAKESPKSLQRAPSAPSTKAGENAVR